MLERKERIDDLGAEAVFVVHDEPDALRRAMLDGLEVPFPVLVDLERKAYRAWGLRRVPPWKILLDPKVWGQYARLLLSGERLRPSGRAPFQLGGDFVVDLAGRIAYSRPQRRDDRPPVMELIRILESCVG